MSRTEPSESSRRSRASRVESGDSSGSHRSRASRAASGGASAKKPQTQTSDDRERILHSAARRQWEKGDDAGAELLFGKSGLHPYYWGVSKAQLEECVDRVREAQDAGEIINGGKQHPTIFLA